MLTYDLETRNGQPLYQHLYHCLRRDIRAGTLKPEEKLPSKRQFAQHLGVSVMTVESAYDQLRAEGYITARPKQGFFVCHTHPFVPIVQELPCLAAPAPAWQVDLHSQRIHAQAFPFATWSKLVRQVLTQEGRDLLGPVPHKGVETLRQAIAEDLRQYRRMAVSPEQIVVGAGAEYLYMVLAQLLGEVGSFGVEDPGYQKIHQVYAQAGVNVHPVALDHQGMDVASLHKCGAKIAHLSPSHQYPTGAVMPIARRQALLAWAQEVDGYLIEDDYDSELRLTGRPLPSMQSIDASGRVIYLNTFSQTIAPSMRIGFIVLPQGLLERYTQKLDFYSSTVPALEQHVLARFLSQGWYERHLSRMRKEYRTRRSAVLEAFGHWDMAHRVSITEQGAGLHFLMAVDTNCSDEVLREKAKERGVRLGFLSDYAQTNKAQFAHTLVVNYASLEVDTLPQVLGLLGEILSQV